jgi:hypothetical protein
VLEFTLNRPLTKGADDSYEGSRTSEEVICPFPS